MKVTVKDLIGPHCIVREDGQKVYDAIYPFLQRGETVMLDFAGVSQFASPFFNFAIGQLLKDVREEDLRRLLQIENLDPTGKLVVERVIDNAGRYHANVDYRNIVDAILKQQAQESA